MKKRIFAIAVVLICISILASTTIAYFTDSDIARNVITSGGIEVKVVEQQLVNGTLQPYPDDKPIQVMPATTVSKIVSVQSTEQAAWVRLRYTMTVYDAEGKEMEIPAADLAKVIIITPNATNWTQKADGWWYYNTAIKSGEMTTPLFETVTFSGPNMDNRYQGATVMINVTAQGVQRANNDGANGWPGSSGT